MAVLGKALHMTIVSKSEDSGDCRHHGGRHHLHSGKC